MNKKEIITRILIVTIVILVALGICTILYKNKNIHLLGEATQNDSTVINIYAMDTYMKISIPSKGPQVDSALAECKDRIEELDCALSTENPQSEVYQLNANSGGQLSPDTYALITASFQASEISDGAFDITVYPLMKLWGFNTDTPKVPSDDEILDCLSKVGMNNIEIINPSTITMFPGTQIDFGGIAKGYASFEIAQILRAHEIDSAILNLGGNVYALGTKIDGSPWKVAIRTPKDANEVLCTIEASDEEVVTSGGYQRFFEENGKIYHHIIDPKSGYPADSGLTSVSIVTKDAVLGDALSTAIFVLGKDQGIDIWRKNSDLFDIVMLTSNNELYATSGLKGRISSLYNISYVN